MKQISLKEMFDSGCHLGTNIKYINPKMRPYIMSAHDNIAIIDILKTYTRLFRITLLLKKVIATEGYRVIFVGTQKSIASTIASIATKSSSNYVNDRWKGGYLTNFMTMKKNENRQVENPRKKKYAAKKKALAKHDRSIGSDLNHDNKSLIMQTSLPENIDNTKLKEENRSSNYGHAELTTLPDIAIIVGQKKENNALKECKKLKIPTITILDSDGDPSLTNLFVPANDANSDSVECILKHMGQSILLGRYVRFVIIQMVYYLVKRIVYDC